MRRITKLCNFQRCVLYSCGSIRLVVVVLVLLRRLVLVEVDERWWLRDSDREDIVGGCEQISNLRVFFARKLIKDERRI